MMVIVVDTVSDLSDLDENIELLIEEQTYRETVRRGRSFMGWNIKFQTLRISHVLQSLYKSVPLLTLNC